MAISGALECEVHRPTHCDDVVAIDLQALQPAGDALLGQGLGTGLRFARHSLPMRSLMIRNVSFSLCASAFWALLPVIARDQLQLGAGGFGLLSAGFGIGAIAGALAIPGQLQRRSLNAVVTAACAFKASASAA